MRLDEAKWKEQWKKAMLCCLMLTLCLEAYWAKGLFHYGAARAMTVEVIETKPEDTFSLEVIAAGTGESI